MKKLLTILLIVYCSSAVQASAAKKIRLVDTLSVPVQDSIRRDTLIEVEIVSTGYQRLPRERATGSFDFINQELIERNPATDFLDRLENLSPGMLFNKGDASRSDPFLIRGRSTITADAQPLIVIDNFPYDGDISNIDPNIIGSVSVLKDAAAASIWGARAGNGVVVITTKRGLQRKPTIEVSSIYTVQPKPDLNNVSWMSASDRVDWELFLYERGYYDVAKMSNTITARANPIPESIELVLSGPPDLDKRLDALRNQNVKEDLSNHFYRNASSHQHGISVLGRSENYQYAFSAGYAAEQYDLVGNSNDRVALRSANEYQVNERLKLDAVISVVMNNTTHSGNNGLNMINYGRFGLSPYASLVNSNREAAPYYGNYRKAFLDTVGQANHLDWLYRPYDEINLSTNKVDTRDYLIGTGVTYTVMNGLTAHLNYQYQQQLSIAASHNSADSYYARNEINRFAQINPQTGSVIYPVPLGGILSTRNETLQGHQGRGQLVYENDWSGGMHIINAIAGYEIRSKVTDRNSSMYYGYNEKISVVNNRVDHQNYYPLSTSAGTDRIINSQGLSKFTDHFLSSFANASYMYRNKYTVSTSIRKDEANLFGVAFNRKGTPLWSVGSAWIISNESFFRVPSIDFLKLRATYGLNGNVSRMASAYTIARFDATGFIHSLQNASIMTPPNESLRWERVKMLNLGLDFSLKHQRVSASIEFYRKNAVDLLAEVPVDPTLAFTVAYANVASMQNTGVDIEVGYRSLSSAVNWNTSLIYSYSTNKVTRYLMPESNRGYIYANSLYGINPVVGKPLYSAYAYQWEGLDAQTGDPLVVMNDVISKDYLGVYNAPLGDMKYLGATQPIHFGAIRNDLSYKGFKLFVDISFKLGHIFRTESLENGLLISQWYGHGDYARRWQNPGDEMNTFVPSVVYPANTHRDRIYKLSSVHYHRADMFRLENVRLSYTIKNKGRAFRHATIYVHGNNLMPIWKSHESIDPYYNNTPREFGRFSLGLQFHL